MRIRNHDEIQQGPDGGRRLSAAGARPGFPAGRYDARRSASSSNTRRPRNICAHGASPPPSWSSARPACTEGDGNGWYEAARDFARIVSEHGGAKLDHHRPAPERHRHRRRPRHHGSRQSRRPRCRRALHRLQHHAAAGAGAQRLFDAGAHLPLPLFRHAQDALRHARRGARGVSRRLRHARRAVRDPHTAPDRQDGRRACPSCSTIGILARGDQLSSISSRRA